LCSSSSDASGLPISSLPTGSLNSPKSTSSISSSKPETAGVAAAVGVAVAAAVDVDSIIDRLCRPASPSPSTSAKMFSSSTLSRD